MESEERMVEREKLDREQRNFRVAAKKASFYPQWLRRVRKALGVQAGEMARELEVHRSVIYRLEESENKKSISLRAMEKMAEAMDCRVVYAIVPRNGKTLMELGEELRWKRKLRKERE
jgi:transcriptional regulator with XRE-family HTH domain